MAFNEALLGKSNEDKSVQGWQLKIVTILIKEIPIVTTKTHPNLE